MKQGVNTTAKITQVTDDSGDLFMNLRGDWHEIQAEVHAHNVQVYVLCYKLAVRMVQIKKSSDTKADDFIRATYEGWKLVWASTGMEEL